MSKYIRAKITENTPVNKDHTLLGCESYRLVLSPDDIPQRSLPGQFYMIGTDSSYDPLLKRPFSIFRETSSAEGGELQFLYRIKGKGTKLLKEMRKGETVNVLGPLGNGYPMPDKNLTPVLIAGGIGIASLFPLAEKLSGNIHFLYGARTKNELLMLNELKGLVKKELIISTDDGSEGEKGTVVDVLNRFLTLNPQLSTLNLLYSCGPSPMLEAVSKFAAEKGIKCYISMEESMACGVGACLGCTVKTKKGYKRVCKEGPVFPSEEIVWT
ncbi:MAG: dihydroorotate dehydrogenase electron transfer subunit [Thermodesulfovibrionales bacterium]|nr:dihydroorotate dehydrogenase electron transfer subunit [Thermodesulfovibrionales bacterium]